MADDFRKILISYTNFELIQAINSYKVTGKPTTAYRPDHRYDQGSMDPKEYQMWIFQFIREAQRRLISRKAAKDIPSETPIEFVEGTYPLIKDDDRIFIKGMNISVEPGQMIYMREVL